MMVKFVCAREPAVTSLSVALTIAREPSAWLEVKRALTLGLFFCEMSLDPTANGGLLKFDGPKLDGLSLLPWRGGRGNKMSERPHV